LKANELGLALQALSSLSALTKPFGQNLATELLMGRNGASPSSVPTLAKLVGNVRNFEGERAIFAGPLSLTSRQAKGSATFVPYRTALSITCQVC